MSKAIVIFEDNGDEVSVRIDFGDEGGQETSGAHQMAVMAVQLVTQRMGGDMSQGEVQ